MRLINATPHPVTLLDPDGTVLFTLPVSGLVFRCQTTDEPAPNLTVDGVTVTTSRTAYGAVTTQTGGALPDEEPKEASRRE